MHLSTSVTRRAGFLLLTAIAAAGCGGAKGRIVRSVTISSEAELEVQDAADGLANHPPKGIVFKNEAEYEPLALEIDRQRVESYFHERGYFTAEVADYRVDEKPDGVEIVFRVDAGPVAVLEKIDIEGAPTGRKVNQRSLERMAKLELGAPVDYDQFMEAKSRMEARLANKGFAHVEVDAKLEVERSSGRAIAHYFVKPGPVSYFGKVRVEGNGDLPASFFTNRVTWDEGDRFDPRELEQTRARLFQSGLISDVHFDRETEEPAEIVDIVVRAARGKRHELKVGAGIGLQPVYYEVRGRIGYTHKSLIDPLLTLRIEGRPSYAIFRSGDGPAGFNWEAGVDLEREDLFVPRLMGSIGAEYRMLRLEGYATSGPTGKIGFARTFFDDRLITSLSIHYEQRMFSEIFFDATPGQLEEIGIYEPTNFAFLAPSLTWDGRDDALTPREGLWANLRLEGGMVFGESSYLKITPEIRGYVPIGSRVVIAMRGRVGAGLLNSSAIPISQRYFGGGAESHRGFGRRRLSPMLPSIEGEQLPVGGEASVETSLEARVDIFELWGQTFGLVAFVDAGDVALDFGDIDFTRLHYAAGPGIRVTTVVGVIRLDAGFRLNRMGPTDPDPDSPFAIHFSLGEAF